MTATSNSARWLLLVLLLLVALGVVLDVSMALDEGPISALRTQEVLGGEGRVDAFCGFAPCGMPLECN